MWLKNINVLWCWWQSNNLSLYITHSGETPGVVPPLWCLANRTHSQHTIVPSIFTGFNSSWLVRTNVLLSGPWGVIMEWSVPPPGRLSFCGIHTWCYLIGISLIQHSPLLLAHGYQIADAHYKRSLISGNYFKWCLTPWAVMFPYSRLCLTISIHHVVCIQTMYLHQGPRSFR